MIAVLIAIVVNQLGFYPHSPKMAIVTGRPSATVFYVVKVPSGDTVCTGTLGPVTASSNSSLQCRTADFSDLRTEGMYRISIPGLEPSYPFRVGPHIMAPVARAALKGFYYQRSAM